MNNKEIYERASIAVITFDANDIITTSGAIELPGDDLLF